jgi:hypothetical protein
MVDVRICAATLLMMTVGCSEPSQNTRDTSEIHQPHSMTRVVEQRYVTCADGSRADIDFLDDGLRMAVTWLPSGPTEILAASKTGEPFTGRHTRAIMAGGTIAFERGRTLLRICQHPHR